MIKKTIAYTDYDGNKRTEDFYFNLSKAELMEMNFSVAGEIISTRDTKRIAELLKDFILRSYGEKSSDGRKFVKTINGHKLSEDFAQTEAYTELFMELATDDAAASEFISGIIPQSLSVELAANK